MSHSSRLAQLAVLSGCLPAYRRFLRAMQSLELVQRRKLHELLTRAEGTEVGRLYGLHRGLSWEALEGWLPVSDYPAWQPLIERQRETGAAILSRGCDRYQPTSGSTSSIKWIPYPSAFRAELDAALSPWLWDMAWLEPRILDGRHYWSLSWLPEDLRKQQSTTDDLELFPLWKRTLMRQTMAVPGELALAPTADAARLATLASLAACQDLRFLSVWSPTFALSLLTGLSARREEVAEVLERGDWGAHRAALEKVPCPRAPDAAQLLRDWNGVVSAAFTSMLWPKLRLVSAWATASSARWAEDLARLLPHARFQGKGLWATEGVVTIPFRETWVLAVTSHFYEFRCLETGRLLPSWGLETGQVVQPVISTSSGLWRYALPDRLTVTGFVQQCPAMRFEGRISGVDLVGEKLSAEVAQRVLDRLEKEAPIRAVSLIASAPEDGPARYVALVEPVGVDGVPVGPLPFAPPPSRIHEAALSARLETLLAESYHYRVARELGQLEAALVQVRPDAAGLYRDHAMRRGTLPGNIKIEPLVRWDDWA